MSALENAVAKVRMFGGTYVKCLPEETIKEMILDAFKKNKSSYFELPCKFSFDGMSHCSAYFNEAYEEYIRPKKDDIYYTLLSVGRFSHNPHRLKFYKVNSCTEKNMHNHRNWKNSCNRKCFLSLRYSRFQHNCRQDCSSLYQKKKKDFTVYM